MGDDSVVRRWEMREREGREEKRGDVRVGRDRRQDKIEGRGGVGGGGGGEDGGGGEGLCLVFAAS